MQNRTLTLEEAMINKEFFLALDQIESELKIDKPQLIKSLEAGLASAYKNESGEPRAIKVTLNEEQARISYMAYYKVVEYYDEIEDNEITLEEAQKIKPNAEIGDIIGEDVTPRTLSRIAAQTAKQVITQRITEAKKQRIMAEMSEREGEIMMAIIRRIDNNIVYVEILGSQMEGVMNMSDQVPGEKYAINDRIKIYVKKIRTTSWGSQVMVSRSNAGLVKRLFEIEVPELKSGLVKVKNIVREAGYRTKMSVYTEDPNLDAIGACIGAKGVRVNAIVSELNGEKVDVILYTSDPIDYISRALSPAKVVMVQLNEEEMKAKVVVPDDKLSLAIGKSGQNARLAARLTGFKIDVKPYSAVIESLNEQDDLLLDNNEGEL